MTAGISHDIKTGLTVPVLITFKGIELRPQDAGL
jgi:hypothetical protein